MDDVAAAVPEGVAVAAAVAVETAVPVGVFVRDVTAVKVTVPVLVTVLTAVKVALDVAVKVSLGTAVSVGVTVSVFSGVSVFVTVTTGVSVGVGTQGAMNTFTDAYETMSRFGPPSAVSASIVISVLPACRFTCTVDVCHTSQLAVDGNKSVAGCVAPFIIILMSLAFTLPFAYLYVRLRFCAVPASTKNMTEDPVVLSRFA
jgi:hypothetical protein